MSRHPTDVTVFLCDGGGPDARIAEELSAALPRFLRGRGHARLVVRRDGDPAVADWFLLLASPDSASHPGVGEAIARRTAARGVEQFQVVVTAGVWVWDQELDRLDPGASTAAHPALATAFPREPRHLVFRGERRAEGDLRGPVFLEQVAEIVAPIHGLTKDEVFGEDVRDQRRTRRLTRATAGALAVLLVAAVTGGFAASFAATEAERQRERAEEQRLVADRERQRAESERDDADSRRLATLATQVSSSDGALARLLAIEAYRLAATPEAQAVLAQAALSVDDWDPTRQVGDVRRLIGHEPRPVAVAFAPGGGSVATVDGRSTLRLWPVSGVGSPTEIVGVGAVSLAFAHDGTTVAAPTRGQLLVLPSDGSSRAAVDVLGAEVGSWGPSGFVVGSPGVALVDGDRVVASVSDRELGLADEIVFLAGSEEGDRVVVGTRSGEVLTLDRSLDVVSRWQLEVAEDQFGERDSRALLAWDGGERVVLPPDNETILGPVMREGAPDEQDAAIAGIYDLATGNALEAVVGPESAFSLPATAASFLPDGGVIAVSPGGLESPPVLGTSGGVEIEEMPLPAQADLLVVSPEGGHLLVAGTDGTATMVPLAAGTATADPGDLADPAVTTACATAGRNLSEAEWATYLSGRDYRATCAEYAAPYAPGERTELAPTQESPQDSESPGPEATGDPFAGIDFANSTYDLGCFVDEEALVDGKASTAMEGIVELVDQSREDRNGDGIDDAVLTFDCMGLTSRSIITIVIDGADPEAFRVIEEQFELL